MRCINLKALYKLYINMIPYMNAKFNTNGVPSQTIARFLGKVSHKLPNCIYDITNQTPQKQSGKPAGLISYSILNTILNYCTQIVRGPEQSMDITGGARDSGTVVDTVGIPSAAEESDNKDIVTKMLQESGIELSETDIDDVTAKYNAISKYYADNNLEKDEGGLTVNDRILNYAKGIAAHKLETQFAEQYQNDAESSDLKFVNSDVERAIADGDMEAFKAAFHQSAKEYIELYDSAEGDGAIDVNELIEMEEKELGRALSSEEKELVQTLALNRIAVLDINENNKIDESEVAAYLWAMSRINDASGKSTGADITYSEWVTAQESMGILDLENPTQEDYDKYAKFDQALRNGYEGLK